MKSLLLFPFRAVVWLLRGVFYPWYIALFFRLPWWILAAIAVFITSLVIEDYRGVIEGRATLEREIANPPPDVVPLSQFNATRDATRAGEVHVSGFYRPVKKLSEWDAVGPNMAYTPLLADGSNKVGAILMVLNLEGARLANWLNTQGQDALVPVAVNGMIETTSHRRGIIDQLRAKGYDVADDVPVIEPFHEGRSKGLTKALGTSFGVVVLFGAAALLCALVAVYRFMRWRGRVQNQQPPPPARRPTAPPLPKRARSVAMPPALPTATVKPKPKPTVPAPVTAARKHTAPRPPFRPRSAKQIVDEIFGPNYGRTPPKK